MEMNSTNIITLILNIINIIIALYLIFLFIKSKTFHVYPCYNIMFLSIILLIDNILRLIPTKNAKKIFQVIQAFLLTFLDKLVLTTITSQSFITYLGVCKTTIYFKNEQLIYFSTLIVGIVIGIILTSIYISFGITNYEGDNIYYYCRGPEKKQMIDCIFDSVFLFFNTIFIGLLLIFISTKKRDASLGIIEDLDYGHHHTKILLMFFVNTFTFVESYLIIYDILPSEYIDLIYLSTCLGIDLYYTINKIIIKESMKIFCRKAYDKRYPPSKKIDSDTSEEELDYKLDNRTDSFDED